MTEPGSSHRLRSRRVALTAAGTGAAVVAAMAIWGPTDTLASFGDDVWAGSWFGTGTFGIESSLEQNGAYANHSEAEPLVLNFGTAISLMPGETAYEALYLRRTEREPTADHAVVSVSGPSGAEQSWDALWDEHITFRARVAPATGTTSCNSSSMNSNNPFWTDLYTSGTLAAPARVEDATFTIGPRIDGFPGFTGDPYIVCFEFSLSGNVDSGSNGQSVYPVWTFTAESQQP